MLKERGVAPFSKWEKELPKFVFDPRFQAIPSYSARRRAIFDHFVRTRAEEECKEKRAAQKAAIEGYKQLLDEAKEDITHNTDYQTFKRKWGHDPRFEALDRKEREALLNEREDIFNEYMSELKDSGVEAERAAKAKRDEEEKLKERERVLRKRKEREEQEVERVRGLKLSERKLSSHIKHYLCANEYKALLAEVITTDAATKEYEDGKTVFTSWSTARHLLKDDTRYIKMPRKDREPLWRRHVKDLQRRRKSTVDQDMEKHGIREAMIADSFIWGYMSVDILSAS
ncbi:putative FF domain-containing protein [Helianthus annuus]|nr:putative FF domain-containing protein [Helianthus annuus]